VIRLRPIATAQTFSIIPTSFSTEDLDAASITIIENGTYNKETSVPFTYEASDNGNYIVITLTPTTTLKEDQIYSLELFTSSDVLYRDLIYITSKTNKKEVFSYPEQYTEHDDGEDKYIVL
jgi:hypothetical protein